MSKNLAAERDRILAEAGFDDIERPDGTLKPSVRTKADSVWRREGRETEQHYRDARHFLAHHSFRSERDRRVWALYSEGWSYEEIAEAEGSNKATCWRIVARLRAVMEAAGPVTRAGRKPRPEGYCKDALKLRLRLNREQLDALELVQRERGVSRLGALREAIVAYAKAIARCR